MLWHIVRFDLSAHDEARRDELVALLSDVAELDVVGWLRVARDVEDPTVVGLVVGLEDQAALDAYRTHPDHQPVTRWLTEHRVPASRIDIVTPDDVRTLP